MAMEIAALIKFTVYLQPSSMPQQHVFDNSKSKPGTTGGARSAGINPVETLGQTGYMVRRYTHPGIPDRKYRVIT
jgi:hypothetical protein